MTVWETEARPVLEAVFRAVQKQPNPLQVTQAEINEELGRAEDDDLTDKTLYDLKRTGYVDGFEVSGRFGPIRIELTEKGYQIVAGWPSFGGESLFSRLLAEVDDRVATAATTEERGRWERLREALVGVGRDVFTNVLSAAAEGTVRGLQ